MKEEMMKAELLQVSEPRIGMSREKGVGNLEKKNYDVPSSHDKCNRVL